MSYWTKRRKINEELERMKFKLYQQSSETKFVEHMQSKYLTSFNKSLSDDGAVGVDDVSFESYTDNAPLEHFDESSSSS